MVTHRGPLPAILTGAMLAFLLGAPALRPLSSSLFAEGDTDSVNLPAMETMDDAALARLSAPAEKGPTASAARYYLGLRKRKAGDLAAAFLWFRETADETRDPAAGSHDPASDPRVTDDQASPFAPLALHQLASLLREQKKTREATMVSEELLKRFPGAIEAPVTLHMLAIDANTAGDGTRAIELLTRLLSRYPGFREAPSAVLTLGALHQKRGRCALARAAFGTMEVLLDAEKAAGIVRPNERALRLNAKLGIAYAFEFEDKSAEALAAYRSLLAETADPGDKAMNELVDRTLKRLEAAPPRKPDAPSTPGRIEEKAPEVPNTVAPPKGGRIGN